MEFKTDIEIAQSCQMKNIREIAAAAGVAERYLETYGNYKAKVDYRLLSENPAHSHRDGHAFSHSGDCTGWRHHAPCFHYGNRRRLGASLGAAGPGCRGRRRSVLRLFHA